jgi:SAM-dependent methyltransferase
VAVSCPVCRAPGAAPGLRKDGMAILFCVDCGSGFWQPGTGFDPAAVYGRGYFEEPGHAAGYDDYASLEPALRANFARRIRALGPPPRAGARLLDLGAAFGFAVDEARRAGWRAVGLELSRAAAGRAARHAGPGGIVVGDAQRAPFADAGFDGITLWDVLEHLPAPHAAVAEVARLLRPGGRVALSTGDVGSVAARLSGARWHLYTLPEHVVFYSREGLRRLLSGHGLRVVAMRAEAARYPLGYLVERLCKTLLGRAAPRPVRFPGASIPVPVNLFDVVTVHAVREAA